MACRLGLASLRDGWGGPLGDLGGGSAGSPEGGRAEGNVRRRKGWIGMQMGLNGIETTASGCERVSELDDV